MTEKLDSLDDVKHSVIGHHAADKIRWENQKAWNQVFELKVDHLDQRLTSMEKRVMWFSGAAAAIGALLGTLFRGIFGA
jgi:hypothetical protein